MQFGHDHLDAGQLGARLYINGNAPAIVTYRHRAVSLKLHCDELAVTRDGLIDGVVDDLPDAMHEATMVC